jgi:hypothetical protein
MNSNVGCNDMCITICVIHHKLRIACNMFAIPLCHSIISWIYMHVFVTPHGGHFPCSTLSTCMTTSFMRTVYLESHKVVVFTTCENLNMEFDLLCHRREFYGWYTFMTYIRYQPFASDTLWQYSRNGLPMIFPSATMAHLVHYSIRYISCSNSNVCKGYHFLSFKIILHNNQNWIHYKIHIPISNSLDLNWPYIALSNLVASRLHHLFFLTIVGVTNATKIIKSTHMFFCAIAHSVAILCILYYNILQPCCFLMVYYSWIFFLSFLFCGFSSAHAFLWLTFLTFPSNFPPRCLCFSLQHICGHYYYTHFHQLSHLPHTYQYTSTSIYT